MADETTKAEETMDFLTVTTAAELAGCTPQAIRRAAQLGTLRGMKVGPRAWMFSRGAVSEWINDPTAHKQGRPRITK